MDRENILRFTNSIVLLSKLLIKIGDKFLRRKLYEKMFDMVFVFIINKNNLSPTSHNQNVLNSINNLLDYLEYLAHISEGNTTPLLLAQKNLLKFKLRILKRNKDEEVSGTSDVAPTTETQLSRPGLARVPLGERTSPSPAPDVINLPSEIPVTTNIAISKPSVRTKFTRLALKSNSNKERIFNYIKRTPDVRAKDVLNEFSALSGRTVKRGLKELIDDGFIVKRLDGIAVYYFQASEGKAD